MIKHAIANEQDGMQEHNDCTVRAIKNATGVPYRDAHSWAEKRGRKNGKGVYFGTWMQDVATLKEIVYGYRISCVLNPKYRNEMQTLNQCMHLMRKGRYIVLVKGHTFAVIDGVIHDSGHNGDRKRVYSIWQVELSSVVEAREQGIAGVTGYWDLAAKPGSKI